MNGRQIVEALGGKWNEATRSGLCLCPAHDDHRPSLDVCEKDGVVLFTCRVRCTQTAVLDVLKARGLWARCGNGQDGPARAKASIVATYDYCDAAGELMFQVCRRSDKTFSQRRPNGSGGWVWSVRGLKTTPYRLPGLLASRSRTTILITEGEKDADNLARAGFVATTNARGAGKWRTELNEYFAGARVVVLPDNDKPGRDHAEVVAGHLHGTAASVRVLELPGLPPKGDVSDWLAAGGTPEALRELCSQAPEWQPPEPGRDAGEDDGAAERQDALALDPKAPLDTARRFLADQYTRDDTVTLVHHAEIFRAWHGTNYPEIDDATIRARVYAFLDQAKTFDRDGCLIPFKPTTAKVNDLLDALRAAAHLPSSVEAPTWRERRDDLPPAGEIIACKNGLLHLPRRTLTPHTPAFYCVNALNFDFDPTAPEPRLWLDFLDALWPDDPQSIDTLQNAFGYFLTADTSHQKIILIVGPRRSGKGTIGRVLTALLGPSNVCAPTLASLAVNFGLAPLIGKQLAIVSDARLSGRVDQHAIAERLLSISGEDGVTVDRKFRASWTGTLPVRFLILTNELPRLADTSLALASRFIILKLTESFYGREDHDLTTKLLAELPGIFNWALDGWRRLKDQGRFVQPESATELITTMEDLSSPIAAFIRDRCIVGPGQEVGCDHLFEIWRAWCTLQGRDHISTVQIFGRDLRAIVPRVRIYQPRAKDGSRPRTYQGLGLQ